MNERMQEKLSALEAIDVRGIGTELEPGVFELRAFLGDGMDYCDGQNWSWIWSIGIEKATGRIHAAVDGRFYQNPLYDCVWLR
jgi:hypothetical protein